MADEKTVTPVVTPTPVISQAIPAIVDSTKVVVPAPTTAPVISQAPAMTATDVKPAVEEPASVVAPTLVVDKK